MGEPGWELTCAASDAEAIYDALHAAGVRPSGTLAQTSMRVEKRFLSFGHDLDTDMSPLEAGLDFAVAWDTDFIGRDALLRKRDEGSLIAMVTIVLDDARAVPLGNEPIYCGDKIIGQTTSAAFGYRVGKPVALGYVETPVTDGMDVKIDIARSLYAGRISVSPAWDPSGARMKA